MRWAGMTISNRAALPMLVADVKIALPELNGRGFRDVENSVKIVMGHTRPPGLATPELVIGALPKVNGSLLDSTDPKARALPCSCAGASDGGTLLAPPILIASP
jgi:hypothetical protein